MGVLLVLLIVFVFAALPTLPYSASGRTRYQHAQARQPRHGVKLESEANTFEQTAADAAMLGTPDSDMPDGSKVEQQIDELRADWFDEFRAEWKNGMRAKLHGENGHRSAEEIITDKELWCRTSSLHKSANITRDYL